MIEVHENKKPHRCHVCCDEFTEKHSSLISHEFMKERKIHDINRSYSCKFCNTKFALEKLLNDHISYVHEGSITIKLINLYRKVDYRNPISI